MLSNFSFLRRSREKTSSGFYPPSTSKESSERVHRLAVQRSLAQNSADPLPLWSVIISTAHTAQTERWYPFEYFCLFFLSFCLFHLETSANVAMDFPLNFIMKLVSLLALLAFRSLARHFYSWHTHTHTQKKMLVFVTLWGLTLSTFVPPKPNSRSFFRSSFRLLQF